ncbi:DNA polymerase [Streptomyces sp. NPDC006540]|uniref:DNA polymerase n=1 Tax=Streptomyces sp. NPDC006540 TaxID=3155353 RepID=UPI0033A44C81
MITYRHSVAGEAVTVNVPQTTRDLQDFADWWDDADARGPIALDTETTGLDIFRTGYRLRTVQFGDRTTAWVIHWERGGLFEFHARNALEQTRRFLIHNAPFDWLVLDRHAGVSMESLWPRTTDTQIKAKLVDPRAPQEGGIGSALKTLSAFYVDPSAPDTQGDLTAVFRSLGLTKATGWAGIPLDHDVYNLYAGLDVILTARLEPCLDEDLSRLGVRQALVDYEHEIAYICTHMSRAGLLVDKPYTEELSATLGAVSEEFAAVAARYGVENVNSQAQIIDALLGMGETLSETTASGKPKVDKSVLCHLADIDQNSGERLEVRTPNPLADAIIRSKRAGKWRMTYAERLLTSMDPDGKVHPFINSLRARTGRMGVSGDFAAQTLPASDWMIRRAIVANPGWVHISTDFQAIEMRVLAALADVKRMKDGFCNADSYPKEEYPEGFDIHMYTARLIKGPGATKADRKIFKGAGFGKVYGGGVATISRQTGAPETEIRPALAAYDRAFPEIKRASSRWQREARSTGMVTVSATGRRLPLDRDRTYAVVNYQCQSAARDCLGQAMIDMRARGLLEYMRLPIHDEILATAPAEDAADVARAFEECMTFDLFGVPVVATADIGGRSWGSLYGADY